MSKVLLHIENAASEQMCALVELADILQVGFSTDGLRVRLEETEANRTGFQYYDDKVVVYYHEPVQLYRAVSLLVEAIRAGSTEGIMESPWHTLLAPMVDCSRNAVNTVSAVKKLVRHLALMGYNSLMLYTEDTYEIPEQPYFGYMRGRYTAEEIREIDSYCGLFGIELIPCIQVLAHLNALLRWKTYDEVFDVTDILLVDEPKTYEFIEQMLKTVTATYTSRQINLGMDEAFLLGCGKYLEKHGYQKRSEIMRIHLQHIMELCRKYGLKPMIWSDMFFRTSADQKTRHYYDTQTPLLEGVQKTAPADVSLIFWDYYHKEVGNYDKLIKLHQTFDNDIIFAGGAWKWKGFAPFNEVSFVYSRAALESCRKNGITKLLLTVWNESGSECSLFSILPVLQLYAETCYCENTTEAYIGRRLYTCAQANLEDFMALDLINRTDKNPIAEDKEAGLTNPPNPCRYLLWQDVLQGLFEKHVENNVSPEDYTRLVPMYQAAIGRNPQWSYIFDTVIALSEVLALKADIGVRLRQAYKGQNKSVMKALAEEEIPEIIKRVEELHQTFYKQWMTENKVFGYDIMDMRFGALKARLQTASNRITDFLEGRLSELPELKEEILWADCRTEQTEPIDTHVHHWWQCTTASVLD